MTDAPTYQSIVGAYLLVGISHYDADDSLASHQQVHGRIVEASQTAGIVLRQADGDTFAIPPELEMLVRAEPAIYRIRSTGEEVENPDFLITFDVKAADA
jgi:hypothetical protein